MRTFKEMFRGRHTFLAVVHVESTEQALRNVRRAEQGGADGVFLINHAVSYEDLLECYQIVRKQFPNYWIGLNCLDLGRTALGVIPKDLQGLWVDNAGIDEREGSVYAAESFSKQRCASGWQGLYFGGVAFKYQAEVTDVAKVATLAAPFVDVITTSGEGTGKAADVGKIRSMKKAIGDHPLAIARDVTPENVEEYMPYADCFLVATGISDSHTELNSSRIEALAKVLDI